MCAHISIHKLTYFQVHVEIVATNIVQNGNSSNVCLVIASRLIIEVTS